ncbi:MAG: NAD+ synthase [Dehalococcoidia bacterium]
MSTFRVALAQINTTVGDLAGNTDKIRRYLEQAKAVGADLVAFPELAIPGYPPEDLLFKPQFIKDNQRCLADLVEATRGITAVIGFVDADDDIFNAAAVVSDGRLVGVYHKMFLPNYGVFDEDRYFKAGSACPVYDLGGVGVGVNVCEDIWYATGPIVLQADAGAQVIVNINASPYHAGKAAFREKFVATRAIDNALYVCYVNSVGGQDELVFDGGSMVFNPEGEMIAQGRQFQEEMVVVDLDIAFVLRHRLRNPLRRKHRLVSPNGEAPAARVPVPDAPVPSERPQLPARPVQGLDPLAEVYQALVLGTHDYVRKNGFQRVLVGLSGGIDSTLVAAIGADALGPDGVVGVAMPSRYNVPESLDDARALAKNLGIEFRVVGIEPTFEVMLSTLAGMFEGTEPNVAEENIQARIRGNILMALSNKFGWLVLTTGNKSEMAMGYATLYGDMAGGFAVIKDVPKTLVYALARHRNTVGDGPVIPQRVLEKPPSAELRPDQKDEDSLPPYPVLDPVLKAYVEEDWTYDQMLELGFDEAHVRQVITAVDRNEYKRRQAPLGIKITPRAFGRDRRLPVVNRYRPF